jgi:hypothetical protein
MGKPLGLQPSVSERALPKQIASSVRSWTIWPPPEQKRQDKDEADGD